MLSRWRCLPDFARFFVVLISGMHGGLVGPDDAASLKYRHRFCRSR